MLRMTLLAELARRLENLIRTGTVHSVQHDRPSRVRVQTGELVTDWLPWIELRAGGTVTWNPPTPGEQVLVFSPGGELAAGVVLSGMYSDAHEAPSSSASEHITTYPDGARTAYDHESGTLHVSGIRQLIVEVSDAAHFTAPQISIQGDIALTGSLIQTGGDLSSNGKVLHTHKHKEAGAGEPI